METEKVIIEMVDSSYPPGALAGKGSAVRRLKGYVSWVQYDVSQYGLYPLHIVAIESGSVSSTKGPRSGASMVYLLLAIVSWHRRVAICITDKS